MILIELIHLVLFGSASYFSARFVTRRYVHIGSRTSQRVATGVLTVLVFVVLDALAVSVIRAFGAGG